MSEQKAMESETGTGIDKEAMYGKYQAGKDIELAHLARRYKLSEEMSAKAADIALTEAGEPMNIEIRKGIEGADLASLASAMRAEKASISEKPSRAKDLLIGAALAAAVGTGGLGALTGAAAAGYLYFNSPDSQQVAVPDTEYDVRFYDREGNLIDVQPITEATNENQD